MMEHCEPVIDEQTEKHNYILRIINLIKMFLYNGYTMVSFLFPQNIYTNEKTNLSIKV